MLHVQEPDWRTSGTTTAMAWLAKRLTRSATGELCFVLHLLCANCCRTGPPEAPAEPLAGRLGPCGQRAHHQEQEECAVNRKSSDTPYFHSCAGEQLSFVCVKEVYSARVAAAQTCQRSRFQLPSSQRQESAAHRRAQAHRTQHVCPMLYITPTAPDATCRNVPALRLSTCSS